MLRRFPILLIVFALIFASLLVPTQTTKAGLLVSQTLVMDCTSLSGDITFQATRDNTGGGQELFLEEVTDGYGTVIESFGSIVNVGSQGFISGLAPFAPLPAANPITYRLYSPAGNGLSEETVFSFSINCSGLPSAGECRVADGAYQALLTKSTLLYWAPDKPTEPNVHITAGNVVTLVSNANDGWALIKWACGTYYIKVDGLAPNPAAVSKPFPGNFR